ncbi:hypothetical protein HYW46_00940 [Candidatus Daviesbacteria bacterium]|nr:hypothetical protein [Candidatus Daviesbacteria bacterium]
MVTCFKNTKLQLLIVCVLTLLAYSNIFANEFATDDIGYFYNWDIPRHIENIAKIFTTDSVPKDEQGVYRPGKALLIMLSYKLWGLNLTGYHLFSLFVHLGSTVLVYFITRKIVSSMEYEVLRIKKLNTKYSILNTVYSIPFITALLFGLHPIHTEAITFILASYDSAGLLFYLLAFWLYLLVLKDTPGVEKMQLHPRGEYAWLYFASILSAAAAFLTYEMTFTLPLVIMLYHFCFRKKLAARIIPYWLILAGVILLRVFMLHIPSRGEYLGGDFYLTMLLMTKVFIQYIQLLILPLNLSLDHQVAPGIYSVVYPAYVNLETLRAQSIFEPAILANAGIITGVFVFVLKWYKKLPLAAFAIGWFFITLLPVSNIIPQGQIMAERYLYLPSFGFCLIAGYSISKIFNSKFSIFNKFSMFKFLKHLNFNSNFKSYTRPLDVKTKNYVFFTLFFLLFSFYFYQTYQRNKDWKDTPTVWQTLVRQNPAHPVANLTLARIYKEKGQNTQAAFYFNKALDLDPNLKDARLSSNFYQNKNLSFFYPKGWNIKEEAGIKVSKKNFEIQIESEMLGDNSIEDYLLKQKESLGVLKSQGLVKLPHFTTAYLRLYTLPFKADIYQFFLFKAGNVIKVTANPVDIEEKSSLDSILESMD